MTTATPVLGFTGQLNSSDKRGMDWLPGMAWHNPDGTFKVRRGKGMTGTSWKFGPEL